MSIFDIERRVELIDEVEKLNNFIISKNLEVTVAKKSRNPYSVMKSLFTIIDDNFLNWEFRGLALDKEHYLESLSIYPEQDHVLNKILKTEYSDYLQYLYYLDFLLNQINYIFYSNNSSLKTIDLTPNSRVILKSIIDNIELILEHNNYKSTFIEETGKTIISKRDEILDAALHTLDPSEDKDLALMLLEYLDFKNKDNIREKTVIIAHMYKYFEQLKHNAMPKIIFKSSNENKNIDLLKDFNFICNEFDMRHWPKNIKRNTGTTTINDEDMLDTLDLAYYLGLQIMNSNRIVQSNTKVEDFKVKYGFKDNGKLSK